MSDYVPAATIPHSQQIINRKYPLTLRLYTVTSLHHYIMIIIIMIIINIRRNRADGSNCLALLLWNKTSVLYTEVREPCCYHLTSAILRQAKIQKYFAIICAWISCGGKNSWLIKVLCPPALCHLPLIRTYSPVLILFLFSLNLPDLNTGGGGREIGKHKMIGSDKLTERGGRVRIEAGDALESHWRLSRRGGEKELGWKWP